MYIADLHIHSRYSMATSRSGVPEFLDLWARKKGIDLIGTGDFTHPTWQAELKEKLVPEDNGFYRVKEEYLPEEINKYGQKASRFVISGEISSIYKKNGKTRKIHNVIILPGLEAAEKLSKKLEKIGNIHSDGRPILGLDSRDLLEMVLDTSEKGILIPAHVWTPHFGLFGVASGFDTMEECFEDLTPYVRAIETGLSSDPAMNWKWSALDGLQLVSNSDAHSPAKLGREANLLDCRFSYEALYGAVQRGEGLAGTIEFFPEEGKYHWDGHRKCGVSLSPEETVELGGICPVCGRKLTMGVSHRIQELSDRETGMKPEKARPYEKLIPLPEMIASCMGRTTAGKKVQEQYEKMVETLGNEFDILRNVPVEDIRREAGSQVAEAIGRLRRGEVECSPGYDGEYGKIRLL